MNQSSLDLVHLSGSVQYLTDPRVVTMSNTKGPHPTYITEIPESRTKKTTLGQHL